MVDLDNEWWFNSMSLVTIVTTQISYIPYPSVMYMYTYYTQSYKCSSKNCWSYINTNNVQLTTHLNKLNN